MPGLGVPVLQEFRIHGTDLQLAAHWQRMAYQEQFHAGLVTT